jgi:hypothetical protein
MPEVAVCTENFIIPAPCAEILFDSEKMHYTPEYLCQHLSVFFPLQILPLIRNIAVLDLNQLESDQSDAVR